ncbi:hypothetical protein [Limosilactobacillus equigenerosi]|uniref:hypothetical protein n=1 Tax=Limosilactobacillus equigenerosi TaxID=417373 RepID=UPI0006D1D2E4|nr:hypothetical protein [Limosilactobacillus equigenerosi]
MAHKNREAKQAYRDYLLGMAGELQQVKAQQQAALQYNFPTIDQLIELVNQYDARIYERLSS